jgi:hypothetical protein
MRRKAIRIMITPPRADFLVFGKSPPAGACLPARQGFTGFYKYIQQSLLVCNEY